MLEDVVGKPDKVDLLFLQALLLPLRVADCQLRLAEDFFARNFPGTKFEAVAGAEYALSITLSEEARRSLGYFISEA
ncbi:hypothetical protein, partial [Rhizobium johnstonii]|uniref:hypothetical protein n=1 Tax=Rhizobium johnstonii TaxID=3019933 RepID=UPI003F9E7F50